MSSYSPEWQASPARLVMSSLLKVLLIKHENYMECPHTLQKGKHLLLD
jgi:hypothetical protein